MTVQFLRNVQQVVRLVLGTAFIVKNCGLALLNANVRMSEKSSKG